MTYCMELIDIEPIAPLPTPYLLSYPFKLHTPLPDVWLTHKGLLKSFNTWLEKISGGMEQGKLVEQVC